MSDYGHQLVTRTAERGKIAGAAAGGALATMWGLESIDTLTGHSLDSLGVTSWDFSDLWSLFTAPFIHFGFDHLAANSGPFLVLAFLIALNGVRRWAAVSIIAAMSSGLFAFFLNTGQANTAGASGMVFGYLTYLVARGFFHRRWGSILMAFIVMLIYGSVLWGVFPSSPNISWQGHLGGALGGVMAAWLLSKNDSTDL